MYVPGKAYEIQEVLDKIIELSGREINVEVEQARLRPIDVPIIEAGYYENYRADGLEMQDQSGADFERYVRLLACQCRSIKED